MSKASRLIGVINKIDRVSLKELINEAGGEGVLKSTCRDATECARYLWELFNQIDESATRFALLEEPDPDELMDWCEKLYEG